MSNEEAIRLDGKLVNMVLDWALITLTFENASLRARGELAASSGPDGGRRCARHR